MEIRKLNTLRGVAALMVVLSHYSNETQIFNGVLGSNGGHFGVMIFFILSGFLMSYLYIKKDFNKDNIKYFIVARAARVLPLFYFIVILSYLFSTFNATSIFYHILNLKQLLSHLLLLSGVSVLWTIPPEIQFYALFVFFWFIYSTRKSFVFIVMAMVFLVLLLLNFPHVERRFFGLSVQLRIFQSLPYFMIGMVFGQLYTKIQIPKYMKRDYFILSFFLIPLLYPRIYLKLFGYKFAHWQSSEVILVVSFVFFTLLFLVPEANRLLTNRVGDFFGKISYSLYLMHVPVLNLVKKYLEPHPYLFSVFYLILIATISSISFNLFENPARKFIRSYLGERHP